MAHDHILQQVVSGHEFQAAYFQLLSSARREILISTFRMENPLNKKSKVLDGLFYRLQQCKNRGVKIKILLNLYDESKRAGQINKRTAVELNRYGIKCRRPQGNQCNHAKILLVDHNNILMGSHNLTRHSFGSNFEVSVLIKNADILKPIRESMLQAWKTYIPIV